MYDCPELCKKNAVRGVTQLVQLLPLKNEAAVIASDNIMQFLTAEVLYCPLRQIIMLPQMDDSKGKR